MIRYPHTIVTTPVGAMFFHRATLDRRPSVRVCRPPDSTGEAEARTGSAPVRVEG